MPRHTMLSTTREASIDVQELQTLYQEKFTLIYRYVLSKVGNREEAEDLTSEIFLKAVRSIDQGRSPQTIQYWLYQIARTTLADYWRAYYRESTSSLDELLEAGWEVPAEELSNPMSSVPGNVEVSHHVPFYGTGLCLNSTATHYTFAGVVLWLHRSTHQG